MERIIITIQITDPETVENYKDVHQDLIFDDIIYGNLSDFFELVEIKIEDLKKT